MDCFDFDGTMPQNVLKSYLSHAATAQWLYLSNTLDDDIRVIKKLGFKFLGRVTGIWKAEMDDAEHFYKSAEAAKKIHAADSEIILQACIFEMVFCEDVNNIKIPDYVFSAFGLKYEDRCFCFDKIIFEDKPKDYYGTSYGSFGIPDISKTETQMWFYYRAVNYIEAGYEAFHMGQIHLYASRDCGYSGLKELIKKMRLYGKEHARRHKILLDAHSHGIVINGESLLDYNAMPYTRYPVVNMPGEKLVLVREGNSDGGKSPDGWQAECLPFLMEYDNWGGKDVWAHNNLSYTERAWAQWWGWDQIAWFANQPEESRNSFLEYTLKWTAVNNPDAYFAFPLRRPLLSGEEVKDNPFYKLNNNSENCPDGFNQEDKVFELIDSNIFNKLHSIANPSNILNYGAQCEDDATTGVRLPQKVVLYGSFQPLVGATANDSNSEITRMYYVGNGIYSLTFVMPFAGEYDFGVSTWGTLSACYSYPDALARSGTGHMNKLTVKKDNTAVRIRFYFADKKITVETDENL